MSLKEILSVFGPGLKNPTLADIEQLSEGLLEQSQISFAANEQSDFEQVSSGSRKFAFTAGIGSHREYAGSDIRGCPTLPQLVLEPVSHGRAGSKFRLFTDDDCLVLAVVTSADLDGRSSTIRWIKPEEEAGDHLSISRQQSTVIVTALPLSINDLVERLERARTILTHAVALNASSTPPSTTQISGSPAPRRRRRQPRPCKVQVDHAVQYVEKPNRTGQLTELT